MTYSLAWKTKHEVFLSADTAITTQRKIGENLTLNRLESSFGQAHVLDETEGKKVEESIVKILLKKNVGATFAGNFPLAIRVLTTFYKKLEDGLTVRESLNEAIFLNSPFPKEKTIQLAIGYYDKEPRLISFNATGAGEIREDETLVQLGSPSPEHKKLTEEWIPIIRNEILDNPNMQSAAMLGILQGYNLFSPQMKRGVGGAFCGLYIAKDGGKWQPDILFIEYTKSKQGKHVTTCFRHDCLVINSPVIAQSACLMTYLPPQSEDYNMGQTRKAIEKCERLYHKAEFQYAVVYNVDKINLTLVEMQRTNKHEFLWIESFKEADGRTGKKITLFPELLAAIDRNEDGKLAIIPYMKSTRSPDTL